MSRGGLLAGPQGRGQHLDRGALEDEDWAHATHPLPRGPPPHDAVHPLGGAERAHGDLRADPDLEQPGPAVHAPHPPPLPADVYLDHSGEERQEVSHIAWGGAALDRLPACRPGDCAGVPGDGCPPDLRPWGAAGTVPATPESGLGRRPGVPRPRGPPRARDLSTSLPGAGAGYPGPGTRVDPPALPVVRQRT